MYKQKWFCCQIEMAQKSREDREIIPVWTCKARARVWFLTLRKSMSHLYAFTLNPTQCLRLLRCCLFFNSEVGNKLGYHIYREVNSSICSYYI